MPSPQNPTLGRPPLTYQFSNYSDVPAVYYIAETSTGRIYVGSSVTVRKRFLEHYRHLRNNNHHAYRLQRSWNKHGSGNFSFGVLEYPEESKLIEREQFWMDNLEPEFNTLPMAGTPLGTRMSEEAKLKMSESHKGKVWSTEQREKFLNTKTGKPQLAQMKPIPKDDIRRKLKVENPTRKQLNDRESQRLRRAKRREERLKLLLDS